MAHNDHQDEMIHQIWKMSGEKYVDVFVLTKYVTSGQRLCRANDITNVGTQYKTTVLSYKSIFYQIPIHFPVLCFTSLEPKTKRHLEIGIPRSTYTRIITSFYQTTN